MEIVYSKAQIRFSQKEIEYLKGAMQIIDTLAEKAEGNDCIFNYDEDKVDCSVLYETYDTLKYLIKRGTEEKEEN